MRAPLPLAILVLCMAAFGALAAWLGADASWDLRNYHLYNAHAALAGTLWTDIAPAQLQSFYHPALDVVQFVLRRELNAHELPLALVLAVPQALAAWLAFGLALRVTPPVTALIATLFGVTGAASLPTVGTAMSEMVPGCLVLVGVGLLGRAAPTRHAVPGDLSGAEGEPVADTGDRPARRHALGAGVLAGAALGLKLTAAPYAAGLFAAVLVTRSRDALVFVAGMAIALLAIAGPWWWTLWRHTGNPVFPYFNQLFRSGWAPALAMTDTRFLPRDAVHAVLFPLLWAFRPSLAASELPVRDPRLLLGVLAWMTVLGRAAWAREAPSGLVRALASFWLVAFAVWETRFGVLRYAAILEMLAGIPLALALAPLRRWRVPVVSAVSAAAMAFTICPNWSRVAPGTLAMDVHPPAFAPGSLVLLLDPAPMAYVAAFAPAGVRFAGTNNNLVHPHEATALAAAVRSAIAAQAGPIWGLETPADEPGEADRALAAYQLTRDGPCVKIRSNLDRDAIRACRLRRLNAPRPTSAGPGAPARQAPG